MRTSSGHAPRRLGIFGGAFDPVHSGHMSVAEAAFSAFHLDSILFIPAGRPPHKREASAPADHRFRMLQLAVEARNGFTVSDMELRRKDTSYSVHTLEELHRTFSGSEFFFIMGLDAFLDLETWYQPDRMLRLADLVVVFRPPWSGEHLMGSRYIRPGDAPALAEFVGGTAEVMETQSVSGSRIYFLRGPGLDVSSSHIRARLAAGESVRGLLPERVESYILSNNLYQVS